MPGALADLNATLTRSPQFVSALELRGAIFQNTGFHELAKKDYALLALFKRCLEHLPLAERSLRPKQPRSKTRSVSLAAVSSTVDLVCDTTATEESIC